MKTTAFSYKQGSSFLHKCPALIKIIFIPLLSILIFKLPPFFALSVFTIQLILAFYLKFTIREQLSNLRAVLYYAIFLIAAKFIGQLAAAKSLPHDFTSLQTFFQSEKETWALLFRLLCLMQSASLLFKTSTTLQIRESLTALHLPVLSELLSLFICFIPQVSKNWQQAERAWLARGGRKNLRMFIVLLPVFFSVSMKDAYNTARALTIRK